MRGAALASLHADYGDDPAAIVRTKEGRALSRRRYHVAEGFFPTEHERADWRGYLYRAGITAQLALSSNLLDMGFADDWCARHIGLRVAKSLAYANATGLGHDCPDMARLAGFIDAVGARISDIVVTLDSHPGVAVERTSFWLAADGGASPRARQADGRSPPARSRCCDRPAACSPLA